MKIAIIGSGLSAASSCRVLEKNDIVPDVYDVGENLNEKINKLKIRLSRLSPSKWSKEDKEILNKFSKTPYGTFPKRKFFGSDLIYKYINKSKQSNPSMNFFLGGFSNVWSASVLFPDKQDLLDWPRRSLPSLDLFRKYFEDIPYVSYNDNVNSVFPNLKNNFSKLKYPEQITDLIEKLNKINTENFITGKPRVFLETKNKKNSCKYCGYCMTGCVYDSFYNSKNDIMKLKAKRKLNYIPDHELIFVSKTRNKIRLHFKDKDNYVEYDKVFLACGALSSSKIMLNSMKNLKQVYLKHASSFVIPFFSKSSYFFSWPKTNTLSQIFIEFKNSKSKQWAHGQFSQPNEIVLNKIGFLDSKIRFLNKLRMFFIKRIFTAYCTIHSNYSGRYILSKKGNELFINYKKSIKTKKIIQSLYSSLSKKLKQLNFFSIKYLINYASNADHYYIGGSFPMKEKKSNICDTDILGQVDAFKNLHLVDSSTFPSIPSSTFGLLCMLNSARITEKAIKGLK